MEVTGVEINPLRTGNGFYKAAATIYIEGGYVVNGIMVAEKNGEVKIRFPFVAKNDKDGRPRTFAFTPISAQARAEIEAAIKKAYYQAQVSSFSAPHHSGRKAGRSKLG